MERERRCSQDKGVSTLLSNGIHRAQPVESKDHQVEIGTLTAGNLEQERKNDTW